ncbi:Ger(x)C family spore germination protein [Paenibacillus silvisoli]|uniref:Ger(x)C family spore germination protein n=1 Tax=Paenibacillus silvisoli TaxID=3110539 RepID=UPI002803C0A4|nr:Ger(x)C family spore germination protein [Paenibacillus silvisoli]
MSMRRSAALAANIGMISLLLTGCWDVQQLTGKKLVNGISIDITDDNHFHGTVRAIVLESKGGGQFDVKDELMDAIGDSTSNIGLEIDNMMPGTLEASKTHVIILGEKLAKKGILPSLESFYRNPKGYLRSNILISSGEAAEVLAFEPIEHSPVAFGIKQIFDGAVVKTVIPDQTLFTVWSQFSEPGEDPIVPMIHKVGDKALSVNDIALFNGDRFTGVKLRGEDGTILLLMDNTIGKQAVMNIPVQQRVISFGANKLKRSMKVKADPGTGKIECLIKVDLYGSIISYPSKLERSIDREKLNRELAEWLNKEAAVVTNRMQKANCDALGIGRHLRVRYPKLWKSVDWEEKYKDVTIKPTFQVHITSTGILS